MFVKENWESSRFLAISAVGRLPCHTLPNMLHFPKRVLGSEDFSWSSWIDQLVPFGEIPYGAQLQQKEREKD